MLGDCHSGRPHEKHTQIIREESGTQDDQYMGPLQRVVWDPARRRAVNDCAVSQTHNIHYSPQQGETHMSQLCTPRLALNYSAEYKTKKFELLPNHSSARPFASNAALHFTSLFLTTAPCPPSCSTRSSPLYKLHMHHAGALTESKIPEAGMASC